MLCHPEATTQPSATHFLFHALDLPLALYQPPATCGNWGFVTRCALSIKYILNFEDLIWKKKSVILIMITCWDDNTFWCQKLSFSVHWCQIKSCRQFRVKQKRITLLLCQAKGGHSRLKPSNHVSSLGEDSEKFYINCLYVFVDWKLGPCPKGSLDCFSSSRIPSLP